MSVETHHPPPRESALNQPRQRRLIINGANGLGNQMFVYAAGRFFAERTGRRLLVAVPRAIRQHWRGSSRPFQLPAYAIEDEMRIVTVRDEILLSMSRPVELLCSSLSRFTGARMLVEPGHDHFNPTLLDEFTVDDLYLNGGWQHFGYVAAQEPALRRAFRLRQPLLPAARAYEERIRALPCPVSVHIRLGDYRKFTVQGRIRPGQMLLPIAYYQRAMDAVRKRLPQASFVVFSDDPEAARQIVDPGDAALWISGGDPRGDGATRAYEEMYLMSCCRCHIIANSTFSWWGAWLNPSPDKLVFAPKYWWNTPKSCFAGMHPPGWLVIDNLA